MDLKIDSMAFGGMGVGRVLDGDRSFVIFVEDTVPGDLARIRLGGSKRKYAYGYVEEFLNRSELRVKPACPHFGLDGDKCGGCTLQFLSYEDQLAIKEQQVKDAIKRIGRIDEAVVLPIMGAPNPWFYRNKMEFSFSRDLEGRLGLGMHVRRRHHDTVEMRECHLFSSWVGDFVVASRDFFRNCTDEAALKLISLVVREGKNTGDIMVNLITENAGDNIEFLEGFLKLVMDFFASGAKGAGGGAGAKGAPTAVYFTDVTNIKGAPKRRAAHLLWGAPVIRETLRIGNNNELHFEISPQAFFQPNTAQAEKLFGEAISAAELTGNEIVYDLYCGAGTIALACSRGAKRVYGIELNESALENARRNAAFNGIDNVIFQVGDVAKELPSLEEKPDVVMVDPPRNGLHRSVVDHICQMQPRRIVYVSCNPSSLARDLALFTKTGYTLERVQPVDMFPQTYHIENVARLVKA